MMCCYVVYQCYLSIRLVYQEMSFSYDVFCFVFFFFFKQKTAYEI